MGDAEEYTDLIAAVQLGGIAEGAVHQVAQRNELSKYSHEAHGQHDHVEARSSALAAYGKSVRNAIDVTDQLGFRDSADIFTEISAAPTSGCGSLKRILVD